MACLLGRLYRNIYASLTGKPWHAFQPLPLASGDITHQSIVSPRDKYYGMSPSKPCDMGTCILY